MAQQPPKKQTPRTQVDAPPPRRNWVGAVGADAGVTATQAFARAGFHDPALVLHWTEIAGTEVARLARPLRFSEKDGVLTLLAEPAAALFLGHESRTLAARINAWAGQALVQRVKFVQGRLSQPSAGPAPAKPGKALKNNDPVLGFHGPDALKAALQSLARWRADDENRRGMTSKD
jgi:hypothetical protein